MIMMALRHDGEFHLNSFPSHFLTQTAWQSVVNWTQSR
jgi:hypothetical protein